MRLAVAKVQLCNTDAEQGIGIVLRLKNAELESAIRSSATGDTIRALSTPNSILHLFHPPRKAQHLICIIDYTREGIEWVWRLCSRLTESTCTGSAIEKNKEIRT
jgi:hypothetical protein